MKTASEILIVGAGPTGMTLALQAHDHGARVRIVDRRPEPFRPSRALIMHPRTLEVLRPLSVTDRVLANANTSPEIRLHLGQRVIDVRLDQLDLPDTAFPHLTLLRQMDVETALLDALTERGITVERGIEVTDAETHVDCATATLRTPTGTEHVTCDFVAGCDGPDSIVRTSAGIAWKGKPYREEIILADVELDGLDHQAANAFIDRRGLLLVFPLGERATWRVLATRASSDEPQRFGQPGNPVPAGELQAMMTESGLDAHVTDLAWSARYRVQRGVVDRFREGRLFIAGDAAHAFSPATGQGLNTGIQDAVNLGWKLALATDAADPEALLASYSLERRPVVQRTVGMTHMAFLMEASTSPIPSLVRSLAPIAAPLIPFVLGQRRLIAEGIRWMSQLRTWYPKSPISVDDVSRRMGALRAGQRLPDRTVISDGRRVRLHELTASPGVHVLLERDMPIPASLNLGPCVTLHRLTSDHGEGIIAVRPDGYIGLRSDPADVTQLREWLTRIGAAQAS